MKNNKLKIYRIFSTLILICIISTACNRSNGTGRHENTNVYTSEIAIESIVGSENGTAESDSDTFNNYYQVIDNYDQDGEESYEDFFKSKDSTERLIKFYKKLKEEFSYREISFQPLYQYTYYDKDEKFIYKGSKMNQKVNIDGKDTFVNAFRTITIDDFFADELKNQMSEGRMFEAKDFQYKGEEIPIIMGSSYQSYYKIGDILEYNYLFENLKFKVTGFFKEGTIIKGGSGDADLNEYICMPYFDMNIMDISNLSKDFQEIYYVDRTNGYIPEVTGISYEEVKKKVEELAKLYDLNYSITAAAYIIEIK